MLLRRYGVVFRELLAREADPAGVAGAAHRATGASKIAARCAAADSSADSSASNSRCRSPSNRCAPRASVPPTGEIVTLSAADPLNLVGIIVPGERVPAISGRYVAFRDGTAVPVDASAPAIWPGHGSLADAS